MQQHDRSTADGFAAWASDFAAMAYEMSADAAAERHAHMAELLEWCERLGADAQQGRSGAGVLVTASEVATRAVYGLAARHLQTVGQDDQVPVVALDGQTIARSGFEGALRAFYGQPVGANRRASLRAYNELAEAMRALGTSMLVLDGLDKLVEPGSGLVPNVADLPVKLKHLRDTVPMLVLAIRSTEDEVRATKFGKVQALAPFRLWMRHVDVRDIDPADFEGG